MSIDASKCWPFIKLKKQSKSVRGKATTLGMSAVWYIVKKAESTGEFSNSKTIHENTGDHHWVSGECFQA